jgi:nucleoside-diphosphate-sugar epimerase
MRHPILVTGGNGTLGRGVVTRLLDAGHEVRVLSRHPRPASAPAGMGWVTGELLSGQGLADAVTGVGAVVHCASDPRRPRVDVDGTRNLLRTGRAAGTPTWSTSPSSGSTASLTATTRPKWVRVPSSPQPTAQVSARHRSGGLDPLPSRAGFMPLTCD